jgi:hypothetical protein
MREFGLRMTKLWNEPEKNEDQPYPPRSPCHSHKWLAVPAPEHNIINYDVLAATAAQIAVMSKQ